METRSRNTSEALTLLSRYATISFHTTAETLTDDVSTTHSAPSRTSSSRKKPTLAVHKVIFPLVLDSLLANTALVLSPSLPTLSRLYQIPRNKDESVSKAEVEWDNLGRLVSSSIPRDFKVFLFVSSQDSRCNPVAVKRSSSNQ